MNRSPLLSWRVVGLAALLACLACGCSLGKAGPAEEYLRVQGRGPGCEQTKPGEPGEPGKTGLSGRTTVGLKTLRVSDSLDRQSVLLATGRVLSASQRWYWEATPSALITQAIMRDINCSGRLAAVWPMRSATRASMVLAGQVTAFEVQTQGMVVRAGMQCQLWDGDENTSLGTHDFEVTAPVSLISAQAIAEAGGAAVEKLSAEVRTWVEGVAAASAGPTKKAPPGR